MTASFDQLAAALASRYRLERELGQGGMATVYLAHDLRHDRKVALKVLRPELAAVIGAERFLQEIKTTANLQHPNILPLHDSGEVGGTVFYVMPYVEGESLRDRIVREKQLPIADAVRITSEVAGALDYAHRHSVIHRDIKPENILLHDRRALVADFGIALAASTVGGARMTETGMSLGTPAYMSPEQAMGERALDARTDVYALGCVLYEMLTGEPPFNGPTAQSIVAKVLTDEPRPLTQLRRTVPAHVEDAVLTALEKLPADRFAGTAEFAQALGDATTRRRKDATVRRQTHSVVPSFRLSVLLAFTTVLALAWAAWVTWHHPAAVPPAVVRFRIPAELTRAPGGSLIAVSPDGTKLVFVGFVPGGLQTRLELRRLDRDEIVPLAGTEGAFSPFFSPDGEWVGYADGPRLRKIRLDGGGASTIVDLGGSDFVSRGAWAPDGTIVFSSRNFSLYRVAAAGGAARRIATGSTDQYDGLPIWLPGNRRFVISLNTRGGSDYEMAVLSAETGEKLARLGPGLALQYVATGDLAYISTDGALVAAPFDAGRLQLLGPAAALTQGFSYLARALPVAVGQSGVVAYGLAEWSKRELVLVTAKGETQQLPLGTQNFRGPRFSPDGRRIAVDVEPGGDLIGDIWVFERGPGTFTRLTFEGSSVFPAWTPDGEGVLYSVMGKDRSRGISRVPLDRSAPSAGVLKGPWPIYEAIQTPGERSFLYRQNADSTGRDIMTVSGSGNPVPFAAGPYQERSPTLSPDGTLVLYASDESGRDEVYLRPLSGSGRAQVSSSGANEPCWGPGGREAYYWSQDTLFAVPITARPRLAVGTRRVVLAGKFVREPFHSNYDIAPDGKSFVFVRYAGTGTAPDVTVVLNWFDTLHRPAPR